MFFLEIRPPAAFTVTQTVLLLKEGVRGRVFYSFVWSVCLYLTLSGCIMRLSSCRVDDMWWAGVNSSQLLSQAALNMWCWGSEVEITGVILTKGISGSVPLFRCSQTQCSTVEKTEIDMWWLNWFLHADFGGVFFGRRSDSCSPCSESGKFH